jgi:hypothetical protein
LKLSCPRPTTVVMQIPQFRYFPSKCSGEGGMAELFSDVPSDVRIDARALLSVSLSHEANCAMNIHSNS